MEVNAWEIGAPAWSAYASGPEGERRTEVLWRQLASHLPIARMTTGSAPLNCLDAGCGTGAQGMRLLGVGGRVTFLDVSETLLEQARDTVKALAPETARRAVFVHGDVVLAPRLLPPEGFDVIVLHSVLEFVPRPQMVLVRLLSLLRPGGLLSVVVQGAWGQVLKSAAADRDLERSAALLAGKTRFISPEVGATGELYTADRLSSLIAACGLHPVATYGCGIAADLALGPDNPGDSRWLELELALGRQSPFREMGRLVHVIARRAKEANSRTGGL